MKLVKPRDALTAVAGIALFGALAAGSAQARDVDVQWSITIGSPVAVYPVTVPVYRAPVLVQAAPVYPVPRYRQPTAWDRDGDGVPNRYDRLYNPPWDRDGDGIPNRYDRRPDRWDSAHREARWDGDRRHDGWRDRDVRPAPYLSDR